MAEKKDQELTVASIAISGVRLLTPILISILVFIGSQANATLVKLVDTVQQIQISMARESAQNAASQLETTRALADHEERIRRLETK